MQNHSQREVPHGHQRARVLGFAALAFCVSGLLTASSASDDRPAAVPRDELPADFGSTIPYGLVEAMPGFVDVPPDPAVFALGRRLFFDPILSLDRTVACASCHDPNLGFANSTPFSRGVGARRTDRNAPSLVNRGLGKVFMWDGRAATLVDQALLPIPDDDEMALPLEDALKRLAADAQYSKLFSAAFPNGLSKDSLARSIAAFTSRIWAGDSAIDRFQGGNFAVLDDLERTGLWLYESKGRCWMCHSGPNFSDEDFHTTGVGAKEGTPEPGRFAVTKDEGDRGRFKTPTLRGLVSTSPYMHDGSLATLEEVVEFYKRGGTANAHLDPKIEKLELDERETRALLAFLRALSRPSTTPRGTPSTSK
jgi:cytochrome c peroxidase